MEQLSLWAPTVAGIAIIIGTLLSARLIVSKPPLSAKTEAKGQDSQLPFEFSPPTVLADSEGTVPARKAESVH